MSVPMILAAPALLAARAVREIVASPLQPSLISLTQLPSIAAPAAPSGLAPGLPKIPSAPADRVPASRGVARDRPTSPAADLHPEVALLSARFKLVFLSVLSLTIMCGAAQLVLASIWADPSANQQDAFEAMGFAWKAGLGSIFGLLGGKIA